MDHFETQVPAMSLKNLHIEDWFCLIIFWGLAVILFTQFFSRYVFNFAFGWSEELSRYLLIVLAFAGASIASRNTSHIAMTLFHRWLPNGLLGKLQVAIECFNVLIIGILGYFCLQIIPLIAPHSLASLQVSLTWVYVLLLVFILAMLIRTIRVAIDKTKMLNQCQSRQQEEC
ncbi:tripartite ATP-independent periplasmic transporter DctQ [Catenovulum agarivorans DS-2]|uniref:TRAP transporter small permease protein n=1 Tax=Catenovulum agarivorans DS-2 TaxID=1328313 RepID=W7QS38_9ALTE|nr:TRAP transporter small permease [Catenovulum agarivorans]EWH10663.1 tripartite ATP-independent periplasmic transporter DctQ [Catenovulum agarivorans DS-2]